ncbi:MAG: aldo/keto reductase, partial [Solirubrobacteraceae bacterium]
RWAQALRIGTALGEPARRLGVPAATLALAFSLRHPRAAATLIGATRPAHIDAALAAVALAERLTDEDMEELRRAGT